MAGLCPFHAERTPSFKIYLKGNYYHCYGCGAHGDAITYVMQQLRLTFSEAVAELAGTGGRCRRDTGASCMAARSWVRSRPVAASAHVAELWRTADDPRIAELYLYSRGIRVRPKPLPDALRGHRAVLWVEEAGEDKPLVQPPWRAWLSSRTKTWWRGVKRPAVLAALQDEAGRLVTVQVVWVNTSVIFDGNGWPAKGTRAMDLPVGKKTLGAMGTSAVRLVEPEGHILGLAEGFESALAAAQLWSMPVWSTCGASRLGSIAIPQQVTDIMIFGDPGAAGEAAAAKASSTYRHRGYSVEINLPPAEYGGWDDFLVSTL